MAETKAVVTKTRYVEGIGRRKEATARVRLFKGTGRFLVNGQKAETYFYDVYSAKKLMLVPLTLVNKEGEFDITVKVRGGGKKAQIEAIRLGIARALVKIEPDLRPTLRKAGLLTRDARVKERKKYGLKGARRAPQWSKR
ncbi:MAG: 30S ribosomal protein S9 [Candidatus Atribacteria bacterium]|nr:30S ribosomal protein S9 [Candidatus Atribacteria bacterium]MCD6349398.1 30S ribosomal protein S9 [Candidatus Atribacteria bacterium]